MKLKDLKISVQITIFSTILVLAAILIGVISLINQRETLNRPKPSNISAAIPITFLAAAPTNPL